jgi:hypothetical protein
MVRSQENQSIERNCGSSMQLSHAHVVHQAVEAGGRHHERADEIRKHKAKSVAGYGDSSGKTALRRREPRFCEEGGGGYGDCGRDKLYTGFVLGVESVTWGSDRIDDVRRVQ